MFAGAVEQDKVRVQLRVQSAGTVMDETRADHIAGVAIIVGPIFTDASPGENFQFFSRQFGRMLMRLDDA
jgi:hypothetical protein